MGVQRRVKRLGWTGDEANYSSSNRYDEEGGGGGLLRLMVCDLILSFLWVFALATIKVFSGGDWLRKAAMYVCARLLFAWLGMVTDGGLYNPLGALGRSVSGGAYGLFAALLGRTPAQMLGYVLGVNLITHMIPGFDGGPQMTVSAIVGVAIEGFLAFVAVIIYLLLKETGQGFFTGTFVSSISRLTLGGLGSTFTGGWMNPGSAFGWAYARGVHLTADHLLVYWIAPLTATLFGSWAYDHLIHPDKHRGRFDRAITRWKSD